MPAVTVPDLTVLPRVPEPLGALERPVLATTAAPSGYEGEGFPVRRAFAGVDLSYLDPFIHLDQMGEVEYAPGEPRGTAWHPHRGFETVTYMIDGQFEHQDSIGGGGLITNGDTQWMTAGSGLLHIERPPAELVASGGLFHGLQLWVNLPAAEKMIAPRYQDIRAGQVALLSSADGAALLRLIAGELGSRPDTAGELGSRPDTAGELGSRPDTAGEVAGHSGPGSTHTPIVLVHATLAPGATVRLPWNPAFNALVYAMSGTGTVGAEAAALRTGTLAVFGAGDALTLRADQIQDARHASGLDVLLLGGRPIREPIAHYGPFVMNTRAELQQAFEDFNAGRLGVVPQ